MGLLLASLWHKTNTFFIGITHCLLTTQLPMPSKCWLIILSLKSALIFKWCYIILLYYKMATHGSVSKEHCIWTSLIIHHEPGVYVVLSHKSVKITKLILETFLIADSKQNK